MERYALKQTHQPNATGRMKAVLQSTVLALLFGLTFHLQAIAEEPVTLMIVVGAQGDAEFGSNFVHQSSMWQQLGLKGSCQVRTFGLETAPATNSCEQLKRALAAEPKEGRGALWLVLIGHGTFDGAEAHFNLPGPDLSATDLAVWLGPFHRPLAVIDTSACSAPFLSRLSATNRVIITATRSGSEQNFARFGQFLAEAMADPAADLDKDGAVSLLEAFLMASRRTVEFYKTENRLLTEHALLDDNGDRLGTAADWFRGLRVVNKPKDAVAVDGLMARQFFLVPPVAEQNLTLEQRARRDALERAVLLYREKKVQLPEDQYYRDLEKLLLPLAEFYGASGASTNASE